jgi:presequence protease
MSSNKSHYPAVGQSLHGFKVTKVVEIHELHCILVELVHEASGAQVMHLGNDDPENMFCLSFRTLPYNSNGAAHILEHTVLCGSEKFPVKDPFFSMSRRSLNTYMNALTGSDFTCYPAASQVPKDFYNLLDVYLDAVFKPHLKELSFMQEGHRIEFSTAGDPLSPLEYKGVVFNEMKGARSSSTTRLIEFANAALFPNSPYGFDSGGDPRVIPSLTYQQLREFHKKFYHPSRCLFFFYGSFPLKDHLQFIAKQTLDKVAKEEPLAPIAGQPRFTAPVRQECTYPIAGEEETQDKTLIAMSWLTCHILQQEDILALNVLDLILMDTDASPLKMALLKSGLCKQASSYMDDEINEIPFTFILKGCNPGGAEELEHIVRKTLQDLSENGIDLSLVESAIHQLEIYRSEITGDSAPFGLSLFMRAALLKQHGGQAEDSLVIHTLFDRLHKNVMTDPAYWSKLINRYFLENPHFVSIVMKPDKELAKKEEDEEKAVLQEIRESLSPKQVEALIDRAKELEAFQKEQDEEDVEILPKLTLKDVPRTSKDYPLSREKIGNLEVFHRSCFTNNIVYADLIFDLPVIAESDLPYARLFTVLFSQMGCGSRDYKANLEYIQSHTGGIGASITLSMQASDFTQFTPLLHIRGKALHRKSNKLFSLLQEMATVLDFNDIHRIKEVIMKHYTSLEGSINQNALRYAINLSASGLNVASKIANSWYGLDYFWKIKEIAQHFDQQAPDLIQKLIQMKNSLLALNGAHLLVTCDAVSYNDLKKHQFHGLQNLETKSFISWNEGKNNFSLPPIESKGYVIASPIAFTAKVFNTISYTHPDAPALSLVSHIFDNNTLHAKLREKGGAYGGGASNNAVSGNFYFYTYRDPNISTSLEAFEAAIQDVINGNFDETDIEEAKLEMIQSMDAPLAPGSQGELAYGWLREGRSLAIRQAFRDRAMALTREQIIEAVQRQILPKYPQGATMVFAGQELLTKENELLKAKGTPLSIHHI